MKTSKQILRGRNLRRAMAVATACQLACLSSVLAQTSFTWDGGDGSSPLWSTAANWNPDGAPADNFNADFLFGGTVNLGPLTNDLATGTISNLTFSAGAGSFLLTGNTFTNRGNIANASGVAQTLNAGMVLAVNAPFGTNTHFIDVGTGSITNGGPISAPAANASIAKIGTGTLVLNSPLTNTLANGTPGGATGFWVPGFGVDEGTVIFDGGPTSIYNVLGEAAFGRNAPTGNKNVTVIMQSGKLVGTTWMGIGRGNGIGDVSADLILNGSSVYNPVNWSGGYNSGDATKRPRGSVVQNGTSLFWVNNNNNNNNFAESGGAYMTHTVNDSATLQVGSGATGSNARARIGINGRQVIKSTSPTATVTFGQAHFGDGGGSATATNGAGAFYNRGVFNLMSGASTDHFAIGAASGGTNPVYNAYGYYLNDTTTLVGLKEIGVGGAGGGDGVLEVKQGTVNVTNWITICRSGSTTANAAQSAMLMVRNGTVNAPNVEQFRYIWSGSGISEYGIVDVGAGGKIGSVNGPNSAIDLAQSANPLSYSILTLSGGGTVEVGRIFAAQANPVTTVNFNGATLSPTKSIAGFLGANLDGVYVYSGGVTFDTKGFDIGVVPMLAAPVDSGITSIPVATPGVGYIGRPIVKITDPSGTGASAIADWNEASGTITGITITSPGSGYSSPTVVLVGGGFTNAATLGTPVLGSVASGGLTKTGAGTLTLLGGATYTGPTVVNGGSLVLPTSQIFSSSGLTVANAGLAVDASSSATLSLASLTLQNSATISLSYGTVFAPPPPAISVSGTLSAPGSGIVINIDGFGLQTGTITLIDYTGTPLANLANFSLGTLPPGVVATLVNNTANTSIDLNITSAGQNLTWSGFDANTSTINANWDIATTTNWVLFGSATPARYQEYTTTSTVGDPVLFDDTLYNDFLNPQPTNINVTTTVKPFKVTVDSTLPYSLTGAGGLAGVASVVKSNTGSVLLGTSNSYSGGTFVYGGSLVITNDTGLGAAVGTLTLGGGALQINADTTNTRPISILADSPIRVASGATARIGSKITGPSRALFQDAGTAIINNAMSMQFHIQNGTVIFDSNARITNTTSYTSIGVGTTPAENGNLVVRSNATFDINQDFNIADVNDARGRLDIQNNAALRTLSLWVGKNGTCTGLVYQTGGTVTNHTTGGGDWRLAGNDASGIGTFGGYYLSGGRLDVKNNFQIGAYGTGEMVVSGGTWNQWGGFPAVGRFTNSIGTLTVSAGQVNHLSTGTFFIIAENGTGTVNLSGSGVMTLTNNLRLGGAGGNGTLNLNTGGKLIAPGLQLMAGGIATLNFNGGTLQAGASSTAFLTGLTAANVLAAGAIFDTSSNNITVGQALLNGGGGGGLTKNGTGVLTLIGANNYGGPTVVNVGRLLIAPAHQASGAVSVADGAGFGPYVNASGSASVGNVTFGSATGATLEVVLNTGSNPTTAPIQAGTLTVNGSLTARLSGQIALGTFPVLKYTGALAGGGTLNPVVAGPQGLVASFSNYVAGSTLYVTVTSFVPGLVWTGTNSLALNLWDLNTTTNWLSGPNPSTYQETLPPGDAVTFNNVGSGVVQLDATASPASVTFNNGIDYSLSGAGRISGTTSLVKTNSGTTTLSLAGNDYTGDTTIAGGTLRLGSGTALPDGSSAGSLVVGAAGTFEMNGFSETINGLNGSGLIGNSGGVVTLTVGNGNKPGNWSGTIDSAGGILLTKVGTNSLTITGTNTFRNGNSAVNGGTTVISGNGTVINTTGEYWVANGANTVATNILNGGTLVLSNNWLAVGRGAASASGTLIVNSGTVQKAGANGNIVLGSLAGNGTLIVNGGQVLNSSMLWIGEGSAAVATLQLNGGLVQASQVRANNNGGLPLPSAALAYFNGGVLQATASSSDFIQNTITPYIQAGGLVLDDAGFALTVASTLSEDGASPGGGLTKLGSGTLTLSVGNAYSGLTTVSNGTLLVDGNVVGSVTVKSGATLGGIGSINGVVTVEAGGSLGAGDSIGNLTLQSAPVLNGSVVAELDRNGGAFLADLITLGVPINYSGTLVLKNTGAPLQVGDTFTLFSAPGYSGSFTLVSQTPGQLVTWNATGLLSSGSVTVATTASLSPPTMTNSVSGGTLTLTWPTEYLGWILQTQTNNLSTGLSNNWVDVPGSGASTSASIPVNPANPTVFIRLRSP